VDRIVDGLKVAGELPTSLPPFVSFREIDQREIAKQDDPFVDRVPTRALICAEMKGRGLASRRNENARRDKRGKREERRDVIARRRYLARASRPICII